MQKHSPAHKKLQKFIALTLLPLYDYCQTTVKSCSQVPIIIGSPFFTPSDSLHYTRFPLDFHMQNSQKNKKILFFCVIFADLIRIVYVMKVCEAEIRDFILRIMVRIKGSEQNVIYLCTDRQRIIKISANF